MCMCTRTHTHTVLGTCIYTECHGSCATLRLSTLLTLLSDTLLRPLVPDVSSSTSSTLSNNIPTHSHPLSLTLLFPSVSVLFVLFLSSRLPSLPLYLSLSLSNLLNVLLVLCILLAFVNVKAVSLSHQLQCSTAAILHT